MFSEYFPSKTRSSFDIFQPEVVECLFDLFVALALLIIRTVIIEGIEKYSVVMMVKS